MTINTILKQILHQQRIGLMAMPILLALFTGCNTEQSSANTNAEDSVGGKVDSVAQNIKTEAKEAKDVKTELKETSKAIEAYLYENKQKLVDRTNAEIQKVDNRIENLESQLKAQAGDISEEVKQERQETIEALKAQRNNLNQSSNALKTSSKEAWDELKTGFNAALTKVKSGLKKAEAEFDSNQSDDSNSTK